MKRMLIVGLLMGALACGTLSSCVSTVHRYVWNRAKVVDEVFWVEDRESVQLYRVGDVYYAKGYIGPARGAQTTHDVPCSIYGLHGGAGLCFQPIKEQGRPVYFRVYEFASGEDKLAERIAKARKEGGKPWVGTYTPGPQTYMTELPPHAVAVEDVVGCMFPIINSWDASAPPRTDAHAWYAYPVGALLAVAVDAPLTLAGNAAFAAFGAVAAPVGATVYACQNANQQQMAPVLELPSAPSKEEKPQ